MIGIIEMASTCAVVRRHHCKFLAENSASMGPRQPPSCPDIICETRGPAIDSRQKISRKSLPRGLSRVKMQRCSIEKLE